MKNIYTCIIALSFLLSSVFSQNCSVICNAGFDSVQVTFGTNAIVDSTQIPCWKTTAPDGLIEVWSSGFFGVPAYSGIQFIELNANYVSTVYQNITAVPGTQLTIGFAHRGRWGVDTMSVSAGSVGGPYTTIGYFADDSSSWGYHTATYLVPNLGTDYSIRFNSIYAAGNNPALGNFLDSVTICATFIPGPCNFACNTNFDSVQVTFSSNALIDSSQIPCWNTTAPDGLIEVWPSGFFGIPSYSGIQFIELNANYVSTVFQKITAIPGTNLEINFAHRGRWGVDTMSVSAGPVGGPYTTIGYFADDSSIWGYYTVPYLVPNMGTDYSIRFNSIYAAGNNQALGNFLDDVSICSNIVGVNELFIRPEVTPFPNPFSTILTISSNDEKQQQLILYDITSRVLFNSVFTKQVTIPTERWAKGIYFYVVRGKNEVIKTGKLIKY